MQLSPHTAQAWINASVKIRGCPIGFGVNLDVTAAEPATELPTVAAAAPARIMAIPPTYLHRCLRRLADGSRPSTPEGSQPPFGWSNVATPIRPITGRPSLPPSSCARCPIRSPYGSLSRGFNAGEQRVYHVPRVELPDGLGCASTPVVPRLRVPSSEQHNLTTYLLVQAYQHLWLLLCDDAFGTSLRLAMPSHPGPRPLWCSQSSPFPHRAVTWRDSPSDGAAHADTGNPNTVSLVWRILQRIRCLGSFAPPRYQGRTSR
jgi:hypothetical protein